MPKRAARSIRYYEYQYKEGSRTEPSFLLDFLAVRAYTLVIGRNVMETDVMSAKGKQQTDINCYD